MAKKHKAKPKKKSKPSTALVKRKASPLPAQRQNKDTGLTTDVRSLTDDVALGDVGLVEVKINAKEEKILAEPVNIADIRVKPTGAAYLPHQVYTRWMHRAFGRTGWAIVPCSKPTISGDKGRKTVNQPYILHIHGRPVAYAMGEHEYWENNAEQTLGDALESTVASALRRCMKRLGVGLELWDRQYLDEFMARFAVKVRVEKKERGSGELKQSYQWRLKSDAPFWNEVAGRGRAREQAPDDLHDDEVQPQRRDAQTRQAPPPEPAATHHAGSDEPISTKQRRRLFAIIKHSAKNEQDLRDWLHKRWGWTSTGQITRRHYEYICACIESPAPLPVLGGR